MTWDDAMTARPEPDESPVEAQARLRLYEREKAKRPLLGGYVVAWRFFVAGWRAKARFDRDEEELG